MQQVCDLIDGVAGLWTATGAQSGPITPTLACQSCAHEWAPTGSMLDQITNTLLNIST